MHDPWHIHLAVDIPMLYVGNLGVSLPRGPQLTEIQAEISLEIKFELCAEVYSRLCRINVTFDREAQILQIYGNGCDL